MPTLLSHWCWEASSPSPTALSWPPCVNGGDSDFYEPCIDWCSRCRSRGMGVVLPSTQAGSQFGVEQGTGRGLRAAYEKDQEPHCQAWPCIHRVTRSHLGPEERQPAKVSAWIPKPPFQVLKSCPALIGWLILLPTKSAAHSTSQSSSLSNDFKFFFYPPHERGYRFLWFHVTWPFQQRARPNKQHPSELLHKRLLAFNWNPASAHHPNPFSEQELEALWAGPPPRTGSEGKGAHPYPGLWDALLRPTPCGNQSLFISELHWKSRTMEAKSLRLGWGQAWRRQGGLGAHPLLFLFPTHYLKRKKKKVKGPINFLRNMTSLPAGPGSGSRSRNWEPCFHLKLF
jgi:hypothetical protein